MTARRLVFAPLAVTDLRQIAAFIACDNPARAATFVEELEATCRATAASPTTFPPRDDLTPGLRMAVHGQYLVFFRELADAGVVRVERVLHGRRELRRLV